MRATSLRLARLAVLSLTFALTLGGCGSDALECSAPAGSFATDGAFDVAYIDELAPVVSAKMQVRVVSADAEAIDLWACEERGKNMWIVEATVSRPASADLPIALSRATTTATVEAVVTRYDSYRVVEEQVADTLAGRISGTLSAFDPEAGVLSFDAVLAEDYVDPGRLPTERSLTIEADLTW